MDYTTRSVTSYYDNLANGKLVGQHCKTCGKYQALPAAVCRHCQSTDLEDYAFSMKGRLIYCTAAPFAAERFMKSGLYPMVFGTVICEEGPALMMPILEGIKRRKIKEANEQCPMDVVIETMELGGNHVPVARVVQT